MSFASGSSDANTYPLPVFPGEHRKEIDSATGAELIFLTTRPRPLTLDHRTYGQGDHPHVGWDRCGKAVVFASHRLGALNVCVARIPEAWQDAMNTPQSAAVN